MLAFCALTCGRVVVGRGGNSSSNVEGRCLVGSC